MQKYILIISFTGPVHTARTRGGTLTDGSLIYRHTRRYHGIIMVSGCNTVITLKQCWAKCKFNVGLMLGHRLRRWPNISPTLYQPLMLAGKAMRI